MFKPIAAIAGALMGLTVSAPPAADGDREPTHFESLSLEQVHEPPGRGAKGRPR